MLSDTPSKKTKKSLPSRSIYSPKRQWSDKQKLEAVQTYLTMGNLALTSRLLGIPEITLKVWKKTEWWKDLVQEVKSQEKMEMSNRLKKIVDASLQVVEDRLVNGDFQYDPKSGEMIRKPVAMKDAHKVSVDLQNRQDILEKTREVERPTEEAVEDKLLKLAEKFADMATKKIEQRHDEQRTVDEARIVREYSQEEGTHQEGFGGVYEETRS